MNTTTTSAWLSYNTPPRPASTTYRPIAKQRRPELETIPVAVASETRLTDAAERIAYAARKAALLAAADNITLQATAREVSKGTPFESHELLGRKRWPALMRLRHQMWRQLRALGWSYPRIGRACAVDHSTVHVALRKDASSVSCAGKGE